jgi:hypothetical protein
MIIAPKLSDSSSLLPLFVKFRMMMFLRSKRENNKNDLCSDIRVVEVHKTSISFLSQE